MRPDNMSRIGGTMLAIIVPNDEDVCRRIAKDKPKCRGLGGTSFAFRLGITSLEKTAAWPNGVA